MVTDKWTIDAEMFKSIINWRQMVQDEVNKGNCKVPPRTGTYPGTQGHENCSSCPGNYYNGGECNYGGHHVLENEVGQINMNFGSFDNLHKRHNALKLSTNTTQEAFEQEKANLLNDFNKAKDNCTKPNCFVYASCIGVDGQQHRSKFMNEAMRRFNDLQRALGKYIQQIENLSWHQVQEFQQKLKQIEELKQENNKLLEEYKDSNTTPQRKAEILTIIDGNKKNISNLISQLSKHPARSLFDATTDDILRDIKKNIFSKGKGNPFDGLGASRGNIKLPGSNSVPIGSGNNNNQSNQGTGEIFLSPQNTAILKKIGLGILIIGALGILYAILKSKLKGGNY